MLLEIEHIDDDADAAGINFVKIDDRQMAKEFGVFALPAVLFFKLGSKDPVIFAGIVPYMILKIFFCIKTLLKRQLQNEVPLTTTILESR